MTKPVSVDVESTAVPAKTHALETLAQTVADDSKRDPQAYLTESVTPHGGE
ncbi:MAG: hypothetical protein QGG36_02160 [Pirellulaceae bacterium]|jgi:hypothetical protein|nr:hypothetical protein [Pirellulaceae bacterium]